MALRPVSDIIMDVGRAADPVQYQASVQKLRMIAASHAAKVGGFAKNIEQASDQAPSSTAPVLPMVVRKENSSQAVYQDFEAFMLQSFIGNMFPDKAEAVFGKGQAGAVWKSLLAQEMAKEVARRGGIGVAQMLAQAQQRKEASEGAQLDAVEQKLSHKVSVVF
ncbi:rod-binding protein [Bartonella sp. DGB2]|uniref:rod-binding protein n=1 Tax=Bartonella sp. DGB2 TaxID=3388426 RepID=UPI00398F95E5